MKGAWRCGTCGEVIRGSWASAEKHADAHGGARLTQVLSGLPTDPEGSVSPQGGAQRPLRGGNDAA